MSETFSLRPLRLPSGWTLRHNDFVDEPLGHSCPNYDCTLLLACHAEWDLPIDLAGSAGLVSEPHAKRGGGFRFPPSGYASA